MIMKMHSGGVVHRVLFAVVLFLPASLHAEPLTLKHAVELALQHANRIGVAAADEQHALRQLPGAAQQLYSSIKCGRRDWLVRRLSP